MKRSFAVFLLVSGSVLPALNAHAQNSSPQRLELTGGGETIVLEPYAPNILRVTLSMEAEAAKGTPGYGIIAKPNVAGWIATQSDREDVYKSDRMVVTVNRPHGA